MFDVWVSFATGVWVVLTVAVESAFVAAVAALLVYLLVGRRDAGVVAGLIGGIYACYAIGRILRDQRSA